MRSRSGLASSMQWRWPRKLPVAGPAGCSGGAVSTVSASGSSESAAAVGGPAASSQRSQPQPIAMERVHHLEHRRVTLRLDGPEMPLAVHIRMWELTTAHVNQLKLMDEPY